MNAPDGASKSNAGTLRIRNQRSQKSTVNTWGYPQAHCRSSGRTILSALTVPPVAEVSFPVTPRIGRSEREGSTTGLPVPVRVGRSRVPALVSIPGFDPGHGTSQSTATTSRLRGRRREHRRPVGLQQPHVIVAHRLDAALLLRVRPAQCASFEPGLGV